MSAKEATCTRCGNVRKIHGHGKCGSCYNTTRPRKVGICQLCNRERPLKTSTRCAACYTAERRKIEHGRCKVCGQAKRLYSGTCGACKHQLWLDKQPAAKRWELLDRQRRRLAKMRRENPAYRRLAAERSKEWRDMMSRSDPAKRDVIDGVGGVQVS